MKGTAAVLDWIDEYPVIVRQKENTSATSFSPWGPAPENEARINDVVEGQRFCGHVVQVTRSLERMRTGYQSPE